MADGTGLRHVFEKVQPDEIYNLAAQSHVRVSFDQAEYTADVVATGTLRLLEALRDYTAVSGKQAALLPGGLVGNVRRRQSAAKRNHAVLSAQPLRAPAKWRRIGMPSITAKPTGCSSAMGFCSTTNRSGAGKRSSPAKSPARSARIKLGLQKKLFLGNLDAKRDWGYAGDYVRGHVADAASSRAGRLRRSPPANRIRSASSWTWPAAYCGLDWTQYVETDPRYFRPTEVDYLLGDASKARRQLGWKPKVSFEELVA